MTDICGLPPHLLAYIVWLADSSAMYSTSLRLRAISKQVPMRKKQPLYECNITRVRNTCYRICSVVMIGCYSAVANICYLDYIRNPFYDYSVRINGNIHIRVVVDSLNNIYIKSNGIDYEIKEGRITCLNSGYINV